MSTEDCCSPTSGAPGRTRGPLRRGSRAPAPVLRAPRPRRRPGPPGLHARVRARGHAHGRPHRGDGGVSRTGGRSLARRLPARQPLALLRTRRHRVRLPGVRPPRLSQRHRGRRGNAGLRSHPRPRAPRRGANDGPATPATLSGPGIHPGARRPRGRPGPADPGARDLATRQRPGPPAAAAPDPRPGARQPRSGRDQPPDRDHALAGPPASVLAPREPVRLEASAGSVRRRGRRSDRAVAAIGTPAYSASTGSLDGPGEAGLTGASIWSCSNGNHF